jgi:hypothetical protein
MEPLNTLSVKEFRQVLEGIAEGLDVVHVELLML